MGEETTKSKFKKRRIERKKKKIDQKLNQKRKKNVFISLFNSILTFVGYLMPKHILKEQ